jgi:hypothetical protein
VPTTCSGMARISRSSVVRPAGRLRWPLSRCPARPPVATAIRVNACRAATPCRAWRAVSRVTCLAKVTFAQSAVSQKNRRNRRWITVRRPATA